MKNKTGVILISLILVLVLLISIIIGLFFFRASKINKLLDLGQKYLEEQDYENALAYFDQVISIDDRQVDAYIGSADVYAAMGDYKRAEEVLREGFEITGSEDIKKILEEELNVNTNLSIAMGNGEKDVVLALDVSGSMDGSPMDATKNAAKEFVRTILNTDDVRVGIVAFDSDVRYSSEFTNNQSFLYNAIDELYAGGGTNPDSALIKADEMLNSSQAGKKIIVLMSDGIPNNGREGEELYRFVNEIKGRGTTIFTLGFFEELTDEKARAQFLMENIANEACHYEVASTNDLGDFFGDVADLINGQKFIYVRLACPVDITVSHNGETLSSSEYNRNVRTDFGSLSFEDINKDSYAYYSDYENSNVSTDDQIKIVRLKEGEEYDILLEATGDGRMDYTIGFMDDYGNYDDFRRFEDVSVSQGTMIDTTASVSEYSQLDIDEDGDGKIDSRLRAGKNGRGEEYKPIWPYILFGVIALLFVIAIIVTIIIICVKSKNKKQVLFCAGCGRPMNIDAEFCGSCGRRRISIK